MNCENCELYYRCGGKDVCPYEYQEAELMNIDMLSYVTGVSEVVIQRLIDEDYFYDEFEDIQYYKAGYFEESAISMVNNYVEIKE